jgi:hypothetical protein
MSDTNQWPPLPKVKDKDSQADVKLALYKAQLEIVKAQVNAEIAESATNLANYHACYQEIYKGYIEVAKGITDRSLVRAEFIQKVAAAIGTAYAAVLALSFSVADAPLPLTGIVPTFFLGLSFFLSAAYVGYLSEPSGIEVEASDGTLMGAQSTWRNNFIIWTRHSALRRRYLLQTSVISLAFGLLALPAPYLEFFSARLWRYVAIGLGLTFLIPALITWLQRRSNPGRT